MIREKVDLMQRFYYNDYDGNYLMSLEFLIEGLRLNLSFEEAKEITIGNAQHHLKNMVEQMLDLEPEKYSESEIRMAVEDAKNNPAFLWIFDEMTTIYENFGDAGLYELFFFKYQEMKKERLANQDDDDENIDWEE